MYSLTQICGFDRPNRTTLHIAHRRNKDPSSFVYRQAGSTERILLKTVTADLRRQGAISSASSSISRDSVGFIDQSTTLQAKRSITTDRYSQLCQVRSF